MIEQLPQAFISHEQFDDALYPAQLRACRAARAHLPQPTIVLHMRDQRATKFPQHREAIATSVNIRVHALRQLIRASAKPSSRLASRKPSSMV